MRIKKSMILGVIPAILMGLIVTTTTSAEETFGVHESWSKSLDDHLTKYVDAVIDDIPEKEVFAVVVMVELRKGKEIARTMGYSQEYIESLNNLSIQIENSDHEVITMAPFWKSLSIVVENRLEIERNTVIAELK